MSTGIGRLVVACPPKLNLYLRVVGRRADGFHDLETVFQSVSGGDQLAGERADELTLDCDVAGVPTDGSNLVLRAAEWLQSRFPSAHSRGARLVLRKRTPVGAGMGGGSVNAAAALVLLNHLWELGASPEALAAGAAELGSDVAFFLRGGTALGTSRGEALAPLATPRLHLVLVRPPISVATGWAYRQWVPGGSTGASLPSFLAAWDTGDVDLIAAALRNDLEPGVCRDVPEIDAARTWLLDRGAVAARMTGSGSVVFGLARDASHAAAILADPPDPRVGVAWSVWTLDSTEAALVPLPCPKV